MPVRWTTLASDDLADIIAYLQSNSPTAAERMAARIISGVETIATFPRAGRSGIVPGTREFVLAPYIVVFRVLRNDVEILRVRHGAQARMESQPSRGNG